MNLLTPNRGPSMPYDRQSDQRQDQPQAPQETGQRLATLGRGVDQELRVNLCEYQGKPFVGLRVWNLVKGAWLPDARRGVTIRVRELHDVADALRQAAKVLDAQQPADPRQCRGQSRGYPSKRPARDESQPLLTGVPPKHAAPLDTGFSEF